METVQTDFRIEIQPQGAQYRLEVVVSPLQRKVVAENVFWKTTAECQLMMAHFQNPTPQYGDADRVSAAMSRAGQSLYQFLFADHEIRQLWTEARRKATNGALRLRLVLHTWELQALPWECLHDGQHFIAAQVETPVVRTLPQEAVPSRPVLEVGNQLRVLFAWATPPGQPSLFQEIKNLANMLESLEKSQVQRSGRFQQGRTVTIEPFPPMAPDNETHFPLEGTDGEQRLWESSHYGITRDELLAKLDEDYQILCFAGHGDHLMDRAGHKTPALILNYRNSGFEDPSVKPILDTLNETSLGAHDLAEHLKTSSIQVVYLAACRMGEAVQVSDQVALSLSETVVRESNLSAIVAMQSSIGMDANAKLAYKFFHALANLRPVDVALSEARQYLYQSTPTYEMILPLLILQGENSRLFGARVNVLARVLGGILGIVLLAAGLLFVLNQHINYRQAQLEGERQRQETLRRDSMQTIKAAGETGRLIRTPRQVWFTAGNTLQAVDLMSGTLSEAIPVGDDPHTPTTHGQFVWVGDSKDTVMRIDQQNPENLLTLENIPNSEPPLITDDWIWIQSISTNKLTRLNARDVSSPPQAIMTDFSAQTVFLGGEYVWYAARDYGLTRISQADPTDEVRFSLEDSPNGAIYVEMNPFTDSNVFVTAANKLYRVPLEADPSMPLSSITVGTTSLSAPLFEGGFIWISERQKNQVFQIDPISLTMTHSYVLPASPQQLFYTPDRLWVMMDEERLSVLDTTTGTVIQTHTLSGLNTEARTVSDGMYLWVTLPRNGSVMAFRLQDGVQRYRLTPCHQPDYPLFDGTSLLISCPDDHQVMRFPTVIYGDPALLAATDNQDIFAPVLLDGYLWILNSQGTMLVYDPVTDRRIALGQIGDGPFVQPQVIGGAVWTSETRQGLVLRLRLQPTWLSPIVMGGVTLGDPVIDRQVVRVDGEVQSLHALAGAVWALHSTALTGSTLNPDVQADTPNTPTTTRIDPQTLASYSSATAIVSSGIAEIDGTIWVGVSEFDRGYYYRLNAATGEVIDTLSLPDGVSTPWIPVKIGDVVWLTAGSPPMASVGSVLIEALLHPETLNGGRPLETLYPYHQDQPAETAFDAPYSTRGLVSRPLADEEEQTLWYSTIVQLPVITTNENDQEKRSTILVLDTQKPPSDDNPLSIYSSCASAAIPRLGGDYIWIGCLAPDAYLWAVNRDTRQTDYEYEDIGIAPSEAVEREGLVWFTFEDSARAAAFDSRSGELRAHLALGQRPSSPLETLDGIWLYNGGNATLQRIDPALP